MHQNSTDNTYHYWYNLIWTYTYKGDYFTNEEKINFQCSISTIGLAGCGEDKAKEEPKKEETQTPASAEAEKKSDKKENEIVIDMTIANDKNTPLEERITKIATDLFGEKTADGSNRDITVESMGDMYYLKMMIDDAVTKKNTLDFAQNNTVKLLKVLKDVEDMGNININWQGNFKDASGNSNIGSVMTVMFKKSDIDKIDFTNFKDSDLKKVATNYGVHKDFK